MRVFDALQTFESPEMKSTYVGGLSYSIRPGNRYLEALAEVWALEQRIHFHHNPVQQRIYAKGEDLSILLLKIQSKNQQLAQLETQFTIFKTAHHDFSACLKEAWRALWR